MKCYDFSMPALKIYLNNSVTGVKKKLTSAYLETTVGGIIYAETEHIQSDYSHPYTFFLNQYEICETDKIDELISDLKKAYQRSTGPEVDNELLQKWDKKLCKSVNIYERHCIRYFISEYKISCQRYSTEPVKQKIDTLDFTRICFFQREYQLMDIFAAYDLAPFHQISVEKKHSILNDPEWGTQSDQLTRSVLTFDPTIVISSFITDMQRNRLYIYRCKKCNMLFVRSNRKASALCQGSFCEQYPEETTMQRYYRNNELFPYKKESRNLSIYLSKAKKNGTLSEQYINQVRSESNNYKKRVEAGMLQEEKYIEWLRDKHQKCIDLASKNREKRGDAEDATQIES